METLAPRALYDEDELGMSRRLPLFSGAFFGSGMGLFFFVETLAGGSAGRAVLAAVVWGGLAGLLFGATMPWLLGRLARPVNDRLYAGDLSVVPAPPPDGYLYRLPCGWVPQPNRAVGGVLYLGPGGLRFDPLLRAPAQFRESLVMEPLRAVRLELVETPLPRWMWIWGRRSLPRIRVRWPGGEANFGVPGAAGVFETLRDRVRELKRDTAVT